MLSSMCFLLGHLDLLSFSPHESNGAYRYLHLFIRRSNFDGVTEESKNIALSEMECGFLLTPVGLVVGEFDIGKC